MRRLKPPLRTLSPNRFNAMANKGKTKPTQIVGTLHSDNAGEFLSRQFEELLEDVGTDHTHCPLGCCCVVIRSIRAFV